tara:strand:+ start:278 stop:517 length:240 start_codon:yes stop_codon:yes gene_type:complete
MPKVAIDRAATQADVIVSAHIDGALQEVEGTTIMVVVPADEQADWLAAYDSGNDYSPSAADSRVIARAVLDELKRATGS